MKCTRCKTKEIEKCEDCGGTLFVYESWDVKNQQISDCMHENCIGCKNGTCSGVHMMSCPCKKCTIKC